MAMPSFRCVRNKERLPRSENPKNLRYSTVGSRPTKDTQDPVIFVLTLSLKTLCQQNWRTESLLPLGVLKRHCIWAPTSKSRPQLIQCQVHTPVFSGGLNE